MKPQSERALSLVAAHVLRFVYRCSKCGVSKMCVCVWSK